MQRHTKGVLGLQKELQKIVKFEVIKFCVIWRLGIVYNQLGVNISSEGLKQGISMRPMQYLIQKYQVQCDADRQDLYETLLIMNVHRWKSK